MLLLVHYVGSPILAFYLLKAPTSHTRVCACWPISTSVFASLHCLPAPMYVPIACAVPNLPAVLPTHDPQVFLYLKLSL